MAIYSSSSDIRLSFCGNFPTRNLNLLVPKSFVRVCESKEKGNVNIYNYDPRNSVISRHSMPQQLEGSHMRKTPPRELAPKLKLIRTLLIDNYDSYTYNIYQELSVVNGLPPVVIRNDEWTWQDFYHYLYEAKAFDNIVISPGPGSPTCPEDIGQYIII
ncbi:hypothetical protein Leryth_012455 [Lithospermum erythrorhizon]|nr:hypothetical protein Leryth_012455 [Lithospermum erythrorhizon]